MIAVANSKISVAWHESFLAMLPVIGTHDMISFRRAKPELKEDLVQEVIANCLVLRPES